jgi:hypothetical protein
MNSTGVVARSNFQTVEISLWFALKSIMMRKLLRQVTIVAFASLSLVSASSADNAKAPAFYNSASYKNASLGGFSR